jgi:hypothetical protein
VGSLAPSWCWQWCWWLWADSSWCSIWPGQSLLSSCATSPAATYCLISSWERPNIQTIWHWSQRASGIIQFFESCLPRLLVQWNQYFLTANWEPSIPVASGCIDSSYGTSSPRSEEQWCHAHNLWCPQVPCLIQSNPVQASLCPTGRHGFCHQWGLPFGAIAPWAGGRTLSSIPIWDAK